MELTSAYAVLASSGHAVSSHVIERMRLASGEVLYQRAAAKPAVIVQASVVEAMNDMLSEALISGTGKRAALAMHAAAGKTGTTQDFRDAWFIGYTAELTAGVWVGNDNGQPMEKVMGGSLPAKIWHDVMTAAHTDRPAVPLPGARTPAPLPVPVAATVAAPLPQKPQPPSKPGNRMIVMPPLPAPAEGAGLREPSAGMGTPFEGMMSLGAKRQ